MMLPGSSTLPAVDGRKMQEALRGRQARRRAAGREHPPARHHDPRGVPERHRGGPGDGRLDQRRAALPGHRPRRQGRAHHRRLRRREPQDAGHRRHDAGRPVLRCRTSARWAACRSSSSGWPRPACSTRTSRTWPAAPWRITSTSSRSPGPGRVREISNPRYAEGGLAILRGNLAPEGAVVKVAGVKSRRITGPARSSTGKRTACSAVMAGEIQSGDVDRDPLRGSEGRPRHARDAGRHQRAGRPGPLRGRGAHHGRPLQRRQPRLLHRPRRPGGVGGRPDRRRSGTAT